MGMSGLKILAMAAIIGAAALDARAADGAAAAGVAPVPDAFGRSSGDTGSRRHRVPVDLSRAGRVAGAPARRRHDTDRDVAIAALDLRDSGVSRPVTSSCGTFRIQLQVSGPDTAQYLPHGLARRLRRRAGASQCAPACRRRGCRWCAWVKPRSMSTSPAGPGPTRHFASVFRRLAPQESVRAGALDADRSARGGHRRGRRDHRQPGSPDRSAARHGRGPGQARVRRRIPRSISWRCGKPCSTSARRSSSASLPSMPSCRRSPRADARQAAIAHRIIAPRARALDDQPRHPTPARSPSMSFAWPQMLWLLLAVPVMVSVYVWTLRRRRKVALRYADLGSVRAALGKGSTISAATSRRFSS